MKNLQVNTAKILGATLIAAWVMSQTGCSHAANEENALTPVRIAEAHTISTGSFEHRRFLIPAIPSSG